MNIDNINLKMISDSRGEKTLEVEMGSGEFSVKSSVPSGKSKGSHEAFVLTPELALLKFETIRHEVLVKNFKTQEEFDNFLISIDNTENKTNFGGNLILALSLAFARLKAKEENKQLFQYIKQLTADDQQLTADNFPHPVFNIINGGAHSNNKLDFQEFQIIPQTNDFGMAYSLGKIFYRKLGELLKEKFGAENISLGDEAGYSAPFESNEDALDILDNLIKEKNYPIRLGLDCAATHFYNPNGYYLVNGQKYSATELKKYYKGLIEKYDILSIEDPFAEESFEYFSELYKELKESQKDTFVIADDLTTTNPKRLKIAIDGESGNVILIKPNQIGTLTETLEVVKMAYENNWKAVVSHRSGETMDDFIADLAVGINAYGIKSGAPAKPERLIKYDRLLEIYNTRNKR